MVTIITVLSKYIIIIMGAVYTLSCFTLFRPSNANRQQLLLNRQLRHLYVFHFFCYLVLFLHAETLKVLWFYLAQVIFIGAVQLLYGKVYKEGSRLITNNMCFLLILGFTMLTRLNFDLAVKQYLIVSVCIVAFSFIPHVIGTVKGFSKYRIFYGVFGLLFLSSVFVIGTRKNGAVNWINIAGIALQPSEFVKILFIFFVASMLARSMEFKNIAITTAVAALYVIVLVLEKDLGGALLFFIIYLVMLFVATGKKIYFFAGILSGSVAAFIAFKLFSHVQTRVNAWLDPWSIIDGGGMQIAQSLFAIGTGGWLGLGLGEGMPYKIPVVVSDFVFSAIAEELGTIFALCLILVCVSCFVLFVDIAMQNRVMFYKLLALGFGVCYIFQVFLTVGGVTKFIPSTGVTLPFVSYGGSSIASSVIIFNIIQGLYIKAHSEEAVNGRTVQKKKERRTKEYDWEE